MAVQSYLRHIGAPADRYLRHNRLPALCEEADLFVPVIKVWGFFEEASREEDHLLGWNAGKYVGDHSINISLLRKLEQAPTRNSFDRRDRTSISVSWSALRRFCCIRITGGSGICPATMFPRPISWLYLST